MKKLTTRLENAITKLYNAFHENKLDAFSCRACAVGNMCNNNNIWSIFRNISLKDGKIILTRNKIRESWNDLRTTYAHHLIDMTRYTIDELMNVERIFLSSFISSEYSKDAKDKDAQFEGLCNVIEYLCKLDGMENVMDYTKLFETENNKPKYQLEHGNII